MKYGSVCSDFIQNQGIARATRIAVNAPVWAVYYDLDKRCYDDVKNENSINLLELEEVLVGVGI